MHLTQFNAIKLCLERQIAESTIKRHHPDYIRMLQDGIFAIEALVTGDLEHVDCVLLKDHKVVKRDKVTHGQPFIRQFDLPVLNMLTPISFEVYTYVGDVDNVSVYVYQESRNV